MNGSMGCKQANAISLRRRLDEQQNIFGYMKQQYCVTVYTFKQENVLSYESYLYTCL